jgi:hypothetical protein
LRLVVAALFVVVLHYALKFRFEPIEITTLRKNLANLNQVAEVALQESVSKDLLKSVKHYGIAGIDVISNVVVFQFKRDWSDDDCFLLCYFGDENLSFAEDIVKLEKLVGIKEFRRLDLHWAYIQCYNMR